MTGTDGYVDLTDAVDLAGAACVWLTANRDKLTWLSGRLVSATWKFDDLLGQREVIMQKDHLKFALQVV